MKQSTKLAIVAVVGTLTAIGVDVYLIDAGMAWRIACTLGALLGFAVALVGAKLVTR